MVRRAWRVAGTLFVLGASACGGDGPTGPPSVATVSVTPSPASVRVGESVVLTATAHDQAGNTLNNRDVTWTVEDATVASVTNTGLVTGVDEGTTNVSAVVEGIVDVVEVAVTPRRVASVDVRPQAARVLIGETIQMTATPRSSAGIPLAGRTVVWSTSDPAVAMVNASTGLVTAVTNGEIDIVATVEQQVGSATLSVVDPTAPRIQAITPYPIVEGQPAMLFGTNLGATAADNTVTVDGVVAAVTGADGTSVTFTVPATGCKPTRAVVVRVTSAAKTGSFSHPLQPGVFTQVALGDQVILGSNAPCIQLDATPAFESYLVGVQSVIEDAATLTPARLVSRVGLTGAAPAPGLVTPSSPSALAPTSSMFVDPAIQSVLGAQARRHLEARQGESAFLGTTLDFGPAAAGALQSAIPSGAGVGRRFTIRVPSHYPQTCDGSFTTIQAELRLVGNRSHWLVDVNNLSSNPDAHVQQLANLFENGVAPAIEPLFGTIPDTDSDSRVAFVISSKVNDEGWLSYPSLYDYQPTATCPASNEGDFLYVATPQPTAGLTASLLVAVMGYSMAHDFTHLIQNRAVIAGGSRTPAWIEEGQAGMGEEAYAHRVTGLMARQNYGADIMFDLRIGGVSPYGVVPALAFWFGFQNSTQPKVTGAPEECTWLTPVDGGTTPDTGPCVAPGPSGGAWAFLRWLTDHYGDDVGGDGVLNQALIDTPGAGFDRVESIVGVPIETLLSRFAGTLYTDDRVVPVDPTLDFPSWNLFEFEEAVVDAARLKPRERAFAAFTNSASVRGASTLYYLISGSGRPATAIEVTDPTGSTLSTDARVWIVRVK